MDGDGLIHWLAKEERPGCLFYFLWMFMFVCPMIPIFVFGTSEHDGIKEPGAFYLCIAISLPFILLCILSESKKLIATFSRAYLYSFIIMSVLSVLYLAVKLYAYSHNYGYMDYKLVKALVFTPLYMACVSLTFFVIETLIKRNSVTRLSHKAKSKELNN